MFIARCARLVAGALLDVIAPRICPACDRILDDREREYCDGCRASLDAAPYPRELFEEMSGTLGRDELALEAIGALYLFTKRGAVQQLVHAVKYLGCYRLGVELGRELGRALSMFVEFDAIDCVVPVPLHAARLRERGYNQAEAIARGVATERGISLVSDAIERTRHTRTQTRLGADTRLVNVRQAFRARPGAVTDRSVLVCDDVLTTGATLNACAEALLAGGARRVCAATVAKDLRTATAQREPLSPALVGLGERFDINE
jgi:ComF family protein